MEDVSRGGGIGSERTGLVLVLASLAASFQSAKAVTVTWDNGAGGSWNEATNWDTGTVPGMDDDVVIPDMEGIVVTHSSGTTNVNSLDASDDLTISGGTLNVASASTISAAATLTHSGGTIGGAGPLAINGKFDWGGSGDTTLSVTGGLTTTAITNLNGTGDHDLKTTWDNNGTVNWNSGDFDLQAADVVFNNNTTFEVLTSNADDTVRSSASGSTTSFNNTGTAQIDGTLGLSRINDFVPAPADTFQILDAGSVIGTFANTIGRITGNGLFFDPEYQDFAVVLVQKEGTPTIESSTLAFSGQGFSFDISGIEGRTYTIEASTNLLDWIDLDTVVAPNNIFDFIDTDASFFTRRFYRVVFPQ